MSRSMMNLRNAILLSLLLSLPLGCRGESGFPKNAQHFLGSPHASPLRNLPLGRTEAPEPAAGHDRLGASLRLFERAILVEGLQAAVRQEDVAVDEHGVGAPARAEHQIGYGIDDRRPIRRQHPEHGDVGLFPGFERADLALETD